MKMLVLGGDRRQKLLFELFEKDGARVSGVFSKAEYEKADSLSSFDVVLLPVPCSKDGKTVFSSDETLKIELETVTGHLKEGALVFGGAFSPSLRLELEKRGAKIFDLLEDEDFVIFNAYLTAQGALRLLLENTSELLASKRILVMGFGKISRALSRLLFALGADVYVAARKKKDLTEARAMGLKAIEMRELGSAVFLFDFVFNTVPSRIFSLADVLKMKKSVVYFELASSPFGAQRGDFEKAKRAFVPGGALPGRFCPVSCAEKMKPIISDYIKKSGDNIE